MTRARDVGAISATVVGLGASIASAVDDLAGPTFCGDAGCGTVHASWFAHPFGIPLSVIGVAFFATLLVWRSKPLAIAGGLAAIGFVAIQAFVIGAWCKLCLIVDTAAIVQAAFAIAGARRVRWTFPRIVAATAACGAIIGATALLRAPVPSAPVAIVAPASTIVEYVDFECPFCRKMNARIEEARALAKVKTTVERRMLPLAMHPHALPAAIAYCCADAQGKAEAMAQALFAAPPDSLDDAGCEQLAVSIGCDRERYRAARSTAEARVTAEAAAARAAGVHGLPTLVIGHTTIVGATRSRDELVHLMNTSI